MSADLPFRCECGAVPGAIHDAGPDKGDHVVCHCTDCQNFARRFGKADRILDENAGTALYQSRCSSLEIREGLDNLRCLHLTEKPTLRWYTRCCETPMFNTYRNGRIPYVTTLVGNADPIAREALGPPLGHLFPADAPGDTSDLEPLSMGRLMWRATIRMAKDVLSGARRRSPLFDADRLEPVAKPERANARGLAT